MHWIRKLGQEIIGEFNVDEHPSYMPAKPDVSDAEMLAVCKEYGVGVASEQAQRARKAMTRGMLEANLPYLFDVAVRQANHVPPQQPPHWSRWRHTDDLTAILRHYETFNEDPYARHVLD